MNGFPRWIIFKCSFGEPYGENVAFGMILFCATCPTFLVKLQRGEKRSNQVSNEKEIGTILSWGSWLHFDKENIQRNSKDLELQ
jgi:hypothetical protein